ncbi:MAG: radical SAM protein [Candidatus Aenigmarchaeota archaeon]|nr:radical SAM protein [Candidatus Aenigmarchaeota archaeon]
MVDIILTNVPVKKIIELHDAPKFPSPALAYLAASLFKNKISYKVIDSKYDKINEETLINQIGPETKYFGISSMTHEILSAHELARKVKQKRPDIKIIIGGCHGTALPKQTLEEFNYFDIVVIGEGEETLIEIMKSKTLSKVKGVAFRKDKEIIVNERREYIDIDSITPKWDDFRPAKFYIVGCSRGCPFQCVFCMRVLGNKVRQRSIAKVIKELKYLVEEMGAEEIFFSDETFTLDKKFVNEFCSALRKEQLHKKMKWWIQTRSGTVNEDILKNIKNAGCYKLGFGVESGDEEIIKIIKKGISLEQVEKDVKLAKKLKFVTCSYFIIGHPGDTKKTIWKTIKFASKINTYETSFGIMIPYPGTEVYGFALAKEYNYRLLTTSWSAYNKQLGSALELTNITRKELSLLQIYAYSYVFLANLRFLDMLYFIWSYKQTVVEMIKNLIFTKK